MFEVAPKSVETVYVFSRALISIVGVGFEHHAETVCVFAAGRRSLELNGNQRNQVQLNKKSTQPSETQRNPGDAHIESAIAGSSNVIHTYIY